jgi:hypothetical protein
MTALPDKPTETRRPDPLRREPPTLDLNAKEVKPDPAKRSGPIPSPAKGKEASPSARPASPAPTQGSGTGQAGATAPTARAASPEEAPVRRRPSITGDNPSSAEGGTATAASPASASKAAPRGPAASATAAPSGTASSGAKTGAEPAKPAGRPKEPIAAPARRAGAGVGSLATVGLLSGLIGAGLALGAEHYLATQSPDPRAKQVESRIAALEQHAGSPQAAAQAGAPAGGADTTALERRIGALEASNKNLTDSVGADRAASDQARQAGANRPADAPAAAAGPDPATRDAITGLTSRIAALEDGLRQSGGASQANTSALAEIRTQLAGLRTSLEDQTRQGTATAQTNAAALSELTSRVASVQSQAAAQAQAATTALQAMQGRVSEDEKRLAGLSEQFTRFGPQAAQAGIRVIVADRASAALRDGAPLGPVLTTLQNVGTPAPQLEPLRPYANVAPPSPAALAREFEPLGRRIVEAARGPATTISDRLMRMADRIVTVRDVGETGGTDVGAQVGRIDKALSRGALAEAASAWDTLPDDAKRISAEWATRLKQRAAAEEAARRISVEALSAIDASLR